jgi:hypothetical protein
MKPPYANCASCRLLFKGRKLRRIQNRGVLFYCPSCLRLAKLTKAHLTPAKVIS